MTTLELAKRTQYILIIYIHNNIRITDYHYRSFIVGSPLLGRRPLAPNLSRREIPMVWLTYVTTVDYDK